MGDTLESLIVFRHFLRQSSGLFDLALVIELRASCKYPNLWCWCTNFSLRLHPSSVNRMLSFVVSLMGVRALT